MARRYKRDSRGRFAGGGGGSVRITGGTLAARTSARSSRQKLAAMAPGSSTRAVGAQKAAVTRTNNKLQAARVANRRQIGAGRPAGVVGGKVRRATGAMSNIRPTGGLNRPAPRSKIVSTNRRAAGKAPLGLKANAVRAFNPKSPGLQRGQAERQIDRFIGLSRKEMQGISDKAAGIKKRSNALMRKMEQRQARAFAQRNEKGITGEIARSAIRYGGGNLNRAARRVIQGRMQRAAAAAARGSKPAANARTIYANQLAYTGKGKPAAGRNNLRPGPRNTQGPPKRKRKPRQR